MSIKQGYRVSCILCLQMQRTYITMSAYTELCSAKLRVECLNTTQSVQTIGATGSILVKGNLSG